ncbi:WecB/TagA/CpsF family glycosyltransferase [Streptomyces sp. RB6PN25]|uniref:WecB/TagA/CpsF family glycosyltransferase n=1 Tax=Streptomyces humicola TaxID=2953240 RepID=A0ABT1PPU2_9ACTN|nr:WecB/TagA/CpsF family glycosyltransferase [Streptomyces humicola]MCQ4079686.1 WecB/TagA/CpsF family glycosyltransferase [Streptomyces humicola]
MTVLVADVPDRTVPTVSCLGVPITAHTRESAAREVVRLARHHRDTRSATDACGSDVHLCNAHTLALADRDPRLHGILGSADLNLPDGQSVVWANQLLHRGSSLPATRVYGPDLFLDVFAHGQDAGLRHYLLGSTLEVLDALRTELLQRFPRSQIVGTCSPPFRPLTAGELRAEEEAIASAGADIVWVGLGTPKQDIRAAHLAAALPVVTVAVGAAFDFVAGHKRQAPRWVQRRGLEWAFRLGCEPRRLWRRYLFGNARFLGGVARQAMGDGVSWTAAPSVRSTSRNIGFLAGREERT